MPASLALDRPAPGVAAQLSTRGAFLVAGSAMCSLAPMVPVIKARLGLDEGTLGLLLLCVGLGSVSVMPFAGGFAARFGCRRVIVVAALTLCAMLPMLALAGSLPALAATLFVFGAGGGTLDVTMNVQAVLVEEASGRPMMSGFHGLFSVGGLIGASGIAALMSAGVASIVALSLVTGGCLLLLAAFGRHLLPYGGDSDAPAFAFPRGKVLLLGALCFVLFMAEGSVADWSGVFLMEFRHLPQTRAGIGYIAFAAMMTLNRLAGDLIVAALGRRRIVLFGGLLAAAGYALAALVPSWIAALVGFALVGIGLANVVPVMFTAAGRQRAMPANLAISAVTTMGYAGLLVGPPMIGFVARGSSLIVAFGGIVALLVLVAMSSRLVTE